MLSNKLTTVIVSISTVAVAFVPSIAFADVQGGIIGNGAFSQSQITATTSKTNTAVQDNKADISNDIKLSSNTGDNNTNFNTGGNSVIETGPATNNTQLVNEANSNKLLVAPDCNCATGSQLLIKDNGAFSTSNISASSMSNNSLFQSNDAYVRNKVNSDANSGENNSNFGTNGNNTILTGQAKNNVGVWNAVNQNIASVGNGNGDPGVFGTTADINGNGAFAQNNITVAQNNTNVADQTNSADIQNHVNSNAESGENSGNDNTGGSTLISTGPSVNNTLVKNLANSNVLSGFNASNCGCDITFLKEAVNGADSQNNIADSSTTSNSLFQTNDSFVRNSVHADQNSGENSASFSTGNAFGFADPTVLAGPSASNTQVSTAVNSNAAGSGDVSMGGWDLNFTWGLPLPW